MSDHPQRPQTADFSMPSPVAGERDWEFQLDPLDVETAADLMGDVMALLPIWIAIKGLEKEGKVLEAARSAAAISKRMLPFIRVFKDKCWVRCREVPNFQPLKPRFETLFTRRHYQLNDWARFCLETEYHDFLFRALKPDPVNGTAPGMAASPNTEAPAPATT